MSYNKNKELLVGHLNVRSLFPQFNLFSDLIINNNLDIMCVSESWLNQEILNEVVAIPDFHLFRKDREGRGGGVCVFTRSFLQVQQVMLDFVSPEGVEYLFLNVNLHRNRLLICVIYRVPSSNLTLFVQHMDDLLSFISPQYENIIFLGDINVDQTFENPVNQCFEAYDFKQFVTEPTRITKNSSKIIDVIFLNNSKLMSKCGVLDADLISDHQLVFCHLKFNFIRPPPKIITFRDFRHFDHFYFSGIIFFIWKILNQKLIF